MFECIVQYLKYIISAIDIFTNKKLQLFQEIAKLFQTFAFKDMQIVTLAPSVNTNQYHYNQTQLSILNYLIFISDDQLKLSYQYWNLFRVNLFIVFRVKKISFLQKCKNLSQKRGFDLIVCKKIKKSDPLLHCFTDQQDIKRKVLGVLVAS